ncbi:DNA gyrase subunit A [Candidatus Margulisiibacteriota bacterium]
MPESTGGSRVLPVTIEDEMRSAYIDYAMSVIVGRALPDVRDGLKPVHRRILYAMEELGLVHNKPHKKSARVVGEVLGKYHPHGDTAVYDSMVRMAQDFSLRYMLVDGQGNFGSVDGDSAAAMRYTEARLSSMSSEMLADLEKETVDFMPNFDESLKEPTVLPSKFPNLLMNGSSGIAVGMATNIPPHNLTEVADGIAAYIEDPEISVKGLMKFIRGPDFPTGGMICGHEGIVKAYDTGRGLLRLRAVVDFEKTKTGKDVIIVKEIPYQANKAQLVERIADHVKEKRITGITDLRDESDRDGMRIYVELKHGANKDIVLNQLYKHTDMQTTFGINLVALVGGVPRTLNLKDLVSEYVKHREEVVTRRTKYDLKRAEEQAHILEGLRIALKNIDAIIRLIKKAKTVDDARKGLISRYRLSRIQAQAILDMRLQKLTGLEREKIEEEYKKLKQLISELKSVLASRKKVLGIVKKELHEIKTRFGDERRTQLVGAAEEIEEEALIPKIEVAILITRDGYIKRMPVSAFRSQQRGGRGVSGMSTREEDSIDKIIVASTHDHTLFFTNKGRVYKLRVFDLPEAGRAAKGQSVESVLEVGKGEFVTAAIPLKKFEKDKFIVMATTHGIIKKTSSEEFENIRRTGIIAMKLKGEDELKWVKLTHGKAEIIMSTKTGLIIRFKEKDVRSMGRTAAGVKGISLRKGDKLISMDTVEPGMDLIAVSKFGFGKRMDIKEVRQQNRGGKGVFVMKLRGGDEVAKVRFVLEDDELLFVTSKGTISKQKASGITKQSRYAKGVRVQRLDKGDALVDIARVAKQVEAAE